jgi:hypothetical protein
MELRSSMEQRLREKAQAKAREEAEVRWMAVHVKKDDGSRACGEEAFGYALPKTHPEFKPWIGSIIYKRGSRPYELTENRLKAGLTCATCGAKIKNENQITVAPEIFTVKSLVRFLDIFNEFAEAQFELTKRHVKMLEYGAMLGITYEMWKEVQSTHDGHSAHLKTTAERFYNLCAVLGACGTEPQEPSKLIRAAGATDLSAVARATGNADLTKE